jgi:hypothetical protein
MNFDLFNLLHVDRFTGFSLLLHETILPFLRDDVIINRTVVMSISGNFGNVSYLRKDCFRRFLLRFIFSPTILFARRRAYHLPSA